MARAYKRDPDGVRAWDFEDFQAALDDLLEVPTVDEAVYRGFFGGGKSKPARAELDLSTHEARAKAIKSLERKAVAT